MKTTNIITIGYSFVAFPIFAQSLSPQFVSMDFPLRGYRILSKDVSACALGQNDRLDNFGPIETGEVHLKDCMSAGSGHWHTITIALSKRAQSRPTRGVKFSTSTIGWKTLGSYNDKPLPWLLDIDHDGFQEVVIWESFADTFNFTNNTFGLVPWAYKFQKNALKLDSLCTCKMLDTTLSIYRRTSREFWVRDSARSDKSSWIRQGIYRRIIDRLTETRSRYCKGYTLSPHPIANEKPPASPLAIR